MTNEETRPVAGVRRRRAMGFFSVLLMIAAVPALIAGFLIYMGSSDSADAHGGVAGGLSGLGEIVGIGVIAAAAVAFVVGAVFYVRSAGKQLLR